MRSSHPVANMSPATKIAPSEGRAKTEQGSFLDRRLSRKFGGRTRPPTWYEITADEYRRRDSSRQKIGQGEQKQQHMNVRHPEEAHIYSPRAFNPAEYNSSAVGTSVESEMDVEAGVLLTRREKKLWATLMVVGSLTVCLICGLIAALAVR